jgi:hypothetical protein
MNVHALVRATVKASVSGQPFRPRRSTDPVVDPSGEGVWFVVPVLSGTFLCTAKPKCWMLRVLGGTQDGPPSAHVKTIGIHKSEGELGSGVALIGLLTPEPHVFRLCGDWSGDPQGQNKRDKPSRD